MAFADLTATLNLNISRFTSSLNTAQRQIDAWSNKLNGTYTQANAALGKHNLGLKDTARIVQGIMISQAFYGVAQSISSATASLWEFNKALDYTQVTYSALFGDINLARDFVAVLQEHAVNTIFDYSSLESASKKLLAYGIEYKNLMFIMKGLTNLGAMSGDADAITRISRALGQIYTKGRLTAEEMRQLADAYVPIYEIVQSSFGLSEKDMEKVGDLHIPAYKVINAVVDYANEKFGSVGEAAMYTIVGLQNRVVDTLKVVGSAAMRPLSNAYKSFLAFFANGLDSIRAAFTEGGFGGVFEALVPDRRMQNTIRQFIANVQNMFMALASILANVAKVAKEFAYVFMTAFNTITPVILPVINSLSLLLHMLMQTSVGATTLRVALVAAAGAFVLLRVHAMSALVIVAVKSAVDALSKSLLILSTIVTKHPILSLIAALGVALVGVSVASGKANDALSKLFNNISGLSGAKREDILQKIPQDIVDGTKAAEQFNQRLEEGKGAAEALEDSINGTGKAAKKANGLLSFDEVFKLNEKADGSGGALGAIDDLLGGISDLGSELGDILSGQIPDFSDYTDNFTDSLFGGLKDNLLGKLATAGFGALLMDHIIKALQKVITADKFGTLALTFAKALARVLLGGFVGYGVDALASLLTKHLWQGLTDALNLSESSPEHAAFGATLGSVLGGAIGAIVGGLPGSLIGAAIGHLAGGTVGLFWDSIDGAFSNTIAGGITGILSAIAKAVGGTISQLPGLVSASSFSGLFKNIADLFTATGLKAIAKGGLIGMAIGFVTDAIAGVLWNTLSENLSLSADAVGNAKIGQTIGSILGTIIGGLLGGPPGALIGGAIGTFAAGFVGLFWEKIAAYFDPAHNALSAFVVDSAKELASWWSNTISGFLNWSDKTISSFSTWFDTTISGFTSWLSSTTDGFSTWWSGTFSGFSTWLSDTVATFSDWENITSSTLGDWWKETTQGFSTWWKDTFTGFTSWASNTIESFAKWRNDTIIGFATWSANTVESFAKWRNDIIIGFSTWANSIIATITKWRNDAIIGIATWASSTLKSISTWVTDTYSKFESWRMAAIATFTGFTHAVALAIAQWGKDILKSISDAFTKIDVAIGNFFKLDVKFTDFCRRTLNSIKEWASGIWGSVKSAFTSAIDTVKDFLNISNKANKVPYNSRLSYPYGTSSGGAFYTGHATGGIFDREHIARFAEGNKAEAVIPLENASAMQPFVNAISQGILEGLAPVLVQGGNHNDTSLPPMYVGTLVADERGLKQLYKKFEIIQLQENARKGLVT